MAFSFRVFINAFLSFFFFFWPCHAACGILVPQPGIEHVPPALEAWSLNHWTSREVPMLLFLDEDTLHERSGLLDSETNSWTLCISMDTKLRFLMSKDTVDKIRGLLNITYFTMFLWNSVKFYKKASGKQS